MLQKSRTARMMLNGIFIVFRFGWGTKIGFFGGWLHRLLEDYTGWRFNLKVPRFNIQFVIFERREKSLVKALVGICNPVFPKGILNPRLTGTGLQIRPSYDKIQAGKPNVQMSKYLFETLLCPQTLHRIHKYSNPKHTHRVMPGLTRYPKAMGGPLKYLQPFFSFIV